MAPGTGLLNAVVTGLVTGSVIALAAIGLGLVYSIAEVPNLAHGELITIGAYAALTVNNPAAVPLLEQLAEGAVLTAPGRLVVVLLTGAALLWAAAHLVGVDALYGTWWPVEPPRAVGLAVHGLAAAAVGVGVALGAPSIWVALLFAALVLAAVTPLLETKVFRKFRRKGASLETVLIASLGLTFAFRFGVQALYGGSLRSYEVSASFAKFFDIYVTGSGPVLEVIETATDPNASLFVLGLSWATAAGVLLVAAGAFVGTFSLRRRGLGPNEKRTIGPVFAAAVVGLASLVVLAPILARPVARPDAWVWATRVRFSPARALVVGIVVVLILLLHFLLQETKLGVAMRASSDNIDLARVTGINTRRVLIVTWMLAGVFAAVSGVILGVLFNQLTVNMGFFLLLPIFGAVILGGVSSPYGGILGGVLIGLAMEVGVFLVPNAGQIYRVPIAFVVLFVVLLVKPDGILGGG